MSRLQVATIPCATVQNLRDLRIARVGRGNQGGGRTETFRPALGARSETRDQRQLEGGRRRAEKNSLEMDEYYIF